MHSNAHPSGKSCSALQLVLVQTGGARRHKSGATDFESSAPECPPDVPPPATHHTPCAPLISQVPLQCPAPPSPPPVRDLRINSFQNCLTIPLFASKSKSTTSGVLFLPFTVSEKSLPSIFLLSLPDKRRVNH